MSASTYVRCTANIAIEFNLEFMNLCANIFVNNVDETAKVIMIVYYDRLWIWNKQISVIHDFEIGFLGCGMKCLECAAKHIDSVWDIYAYYIRIR